MTKALTYMTMTTFVPADTEVSFSLWIRIFRQNTHIGRCEKGCCLTFRINRSHVSRLPKFKHLLN